MPPIKKDKQICDFNIKVFNKKKRVEEAAGGVTRGKKPPKNTTPPSPSSGGTIYLNFYGKVVTGTSWNVYGDFTVIDAGLTAEEIDTIKNKIVSYYNPYNVIVTTDETIFNNTAPGKRIEIIFTQSHEWYGNNAGGVAYLNSFTWTTQESPAFVFTTLLAYSTHKITEAGAHEAGHTLGLRHQVVCDNGVVVNSYNPGDGMTAPIMGVSYYVPSGDFRLGPCSSACALQDDVAILTARLGLKV